MSTHAVFSPSSAHRWMRCHGSVALSQGLRDDSSAHADEGTAAHFLASECLEKATGAQVHFGARILVTRNGAEWLTDGRVAGNAAREFTVDQDMVDHVQDYLDTVRDFALGGHLLVEERVEFGVRIGVLEQFGTADAIVIQDEGDELQVHDLKYGRGVKVDADENEQLQLYALGALDLVELLGYAPKRVRLVIHQPRLQHCSEWGCSVEDLLAFGEKARAAASHSQGCIDLGVDEAEDLTPGEKQCRWCLAKATCPALRDAVLEPVFGGAPATPEGFDDATVPAAKHIEPTTEAWLAAAMGKLELIEGWCKAVRAETERRLFAGVPVAGWKLVEGRRGSRKWADEKAAEEALKAMRIKHDQMYDYSVISPTSAEKLAKAEVIGPRQWPKLLSLITQSEGKPSVAPESDKRPALVVTPTADEFSDETAADLV